MALADSFKRFLEDPPPGHAFEISESGLAAARLGSGAPEMRFQALAPGTLAISPVKDNVLDASALQAAVTAFAGENANRKRRAALILPDYCARVTVLDFDSFPSAAQEQLALVRFRLKKSLPFDVEGAAMSFYAQSRNKSGKIEVVVAVTALEIVSRYEAPFRAAGFQPGFVTTSMLAALQLVNPGGVTVLAKLSGKTLAVAALEDSALRLVRCVELEQAEAGDIEAVLMPTLAFVEDQLSSPARRVLLCGFPSHVEQWSGKWATEWNLTVEPLRSRFGAPGEATAGLLGFMESVAA